MALRVAFLGTPEVAVAPLHALLGSPHRVIGAVTGPDRPRGRGMGLQPPPVKARALEAAVPVLQPPTLRDAGVRGELAALGADVFAVAAYGKILPKEVLEIPPLGCVNLHFSLLPRLRGAAPVQWALLQGYTLTGVTVIQMDEGMDSGPILARLEEPVLPEDTAGTLEARLGARGASLLVETLGRLERGEVRPVSQNEALATYAPKLSPEDARIDWAEEAGAIVNRIRAFNPKPGAWTAWRSRRIKVWRAVVAPDVATAGPGTIEVTSPEILAVDSGTMKVVLEEVQPEGSRRMSAAEFARGYRPITGDRFA